MSVMAMGPVSSFLAALPAAELDAATSDFFGERGRPPARPDALSPSARPSVPEVSAAVAVAVAVVVEARSDEAGLAFAAAGDGAFLPSTLATGVGVAATGAEAAPATGESLLAASLSPLPGCADAGVAAVEGESPFPAATAGVATVGVATVGVATAAAGDVAAGDSALLFAFSPDPPAGGCPWAAVAAGSAGVRVAAGDASFPVPISFSTTGWCAAGDGVAIGSTLSCVIPEGD